MCPDRPPRQGSAQPVPYEIRGLLQHQAWLDRVTPPVEQLAPDLWSIPVPIPNSPLRYVSVYVLAGEGGLTLIDAGWGSEESWQALTAGLSSIGASVSDIRGVLVTHIHYDHIGLAFRIRQAAGSWIALHPADNVAMQKLSLRDPEIAIAAEIEWLVSIGASTAEAESIVGTAERYAMFNDVGLPDRLLEHGDPAGARGWSLQALHTPGHTPGHLCFVDRERELLFAGDHVLPRVTPNISVDRTREPNPLGDYLQSLKLVVGEGVEEVLPAHEWRFRGLTVRTAQIAQHHEDRLNELYAAVRQHPHSVPWTLAGELTWSRPWDQYDGRIRVFAVTETVSHLYLLVHRGRITASDGPVPRYSVAD